MPVGIWSRVSGTGGLFSPELGTFTPDLNATTSSFEYRITGVAPCIADVSTATLFVNEGSNGPAVTAFCEESPFVPNSILIDWNNGVGITSFNYYYTINNGPMIRGNTLFSNFELFNLPANATISFTVQPIGNICFPTTTTTCGTLSTSKFQSDNFTYYPNPFTDILNLKSTKQIKRIEIYNVVGLQVFDDNFREEEININLAHFSKGAYFVKVYTENAIKTFKAIKD